MQEQFLTEYNEKDIVELLHEIVFNGSISKIFTLESIIAQKRDIVDKIGGINLILAYIYFTMLNPEQKQIFFILKDYLFRNLFIDRNIKVMTDVELSQTILEEIKRSDDFIIEDAYLYGLSMEIYCHFLKQDFNKTKLDCIPEEKINLLFESLFIRDYSKFNDHVLIALIIWMGVYDFAYHDNIISDYVKELIALIIRKQINGIFYKYESDSLDDMDTIICDTYADRFYDLKIK